LLSSRLMSPASPSFTTSSSSGSFAKSRKPSF
jgi:hypothetical protein